MRRLILAVLAAVSIGGAALAAAVPASASTGRPSAVTSFCPSGGGFNGTQQDAGGLLLGYTSGQLTASSTTTLFGSCFRFAPPAAHAVPGVNPKVIQQAPAGTANGSALTETGGKGLAFTADQNLLTQQWIFNGDGTWSPASDRGLVLRTNGSGHAVTLAAYNPADVLPSEDFTFVPGA
jgi:hypothetical protein